MSNLAERVRELWSTNPAEQRALMRTLQAEGYKPGEILQEIQVLRSGGQRRAKKVPSVDPRLVGCQRDLRHRIVDPFTLKSISPENLVSYATKEGVRFCFDRRSLYRQYVLGGYQSLQNPFTRDTLPSSLQQEVVAYGESLRTTVTFNHQKIVIEPFTMIGEVIVQYFTSLGTDYLQRMATTNVLYHGQSLYRERLTADAQTLNAPIETRPFTSLLEKSELLILLFEFVKELRARPQYETIYLHLGSVLEMTPLVAKEDGFDLQLTADMTVIEVVKEFYRALEALPANADENVYHKYDIVTEYGESLAYLNLQQSISAQVPGEVLHYVPYESEEDEAETVFNYQLEAFYENDRQWLDEINAGEGAPRYPDPQYYELNYTVNEFRDYLLQMVEEKRLRQDNYSISELLASIEYRKVENTLVYPVLLRVIETNAVNDLRILIRMFDTIHHFRYEHALRKYTLSEMQEQVRYVVAEYLAGAKGIALVGKFYSDADFYTDDYTTLVKLDDADMFLYVFERLVAGKHVAYIDSLLQHAIMVPNLKIAQVVRAKIDAKYTWQLLFGSIPTEEYKLLLARLAVKDLQRGFADLVWLERLVGNKYFEEHFALLMQRIDDETYSTANWSSCAEIFNYEGIVEALRDPFFVLNKVLEKEGGEEEIPYFISVLSAEQARQVLTQYPSAYGLEAALRMGYQIELPAVGTRARTGLIEDVVHIGRCDLLLKHLASLQEDTDLAVEIILQEEKKIHRQTASHLLVGATYDDALPLLEKYFTEQLTFGVLPRDYFSRYLRENPELSASLTSEQRELLS